MLTISDAYYNTRGNDIICNDGYFSLHFDEVMPNPYEEFSSDCRLVLDESTKNFRAPSPYQQSYESELLNILSLYYPQADFYEMIFCYQLYGLALKLLSKNCVVFAWAHDYMGEVHYMEVSPDTTKGIEPEGFAYMLPEVIAREHMTREQQRSCLTGYLEDYAAWARGDVYYIRYTSAGGATECIGCLYGSYDLHEILENYFDDSIKFNEKNNLILI